MNTKDANPALLISSFYDLRELYRRFLRFLIEAARNRGEIREDDPHQVEAFLAKNQKEFLLPLLEKTPLYEEFKMHLAEDRGAEHLDPAILHQAGSDLLSGCKLGLIGCHYRSFSLEPLRTSAYHATPAFIARVRELGLTESGAEEDFHRRLITAYFDLFPKNKTFIQRTLNSSPQGPLGFIFKSENEVSEEERHESLVLGSMCDECSIPARLKSPLIEEGCLKILLRAQGRINDAEWLEHCAALSRYRTALLKSIRHSKGFALLKDFLAKKLPLMEPQVEDILILVQSYLVYGLIAGSCIYTFPSAQPELQTCGFTIMCDHPLQPASIEFLQRISELIYGELFSSTLARARQRLLQLIPDERASSALTEMLAGTSIPIRALETFLSFARRLPQAMTYERRRHDVLMVLAHPEYLECFVDQVVRRRSQAPRKPQVFLYNDHLSMEHAFHDMRNHASERSAPDHILFFTYPPFDPSIIDTNHFFSEKSQGGQEKRRREEAISNREAILLSDCISTTALFGSTTSQIDSERTHLGDGIAAALTVDHKEALVLSYESSGEKAKIYHDGSLVLEAEFFQWRLPSNDVFIFRENLTCVVRSFFQRGRESRSSPSLAELVTERLNNLLIQKSRSREGLFLVFHPGASIPKRWKQLGNPQQIILPVQELTITDLAEEVDNIFNFIADSSRTDGAIVLSMGTKTIRVYNRIDIIDHLGSDRQEIKRLQANRYPAIMSFGTKHTAAYEYALSGAKERGFALTVSSDGPITLFYPDKMSQELVDELEEQRRPSSGRSVTIVRI